MLGIFGMKILDKINIMKIFVFGSKGMLGTYLVKYLNQYYKVIEINRDIIDASKETEETLHEKLKDKIHNGDTIINCMGAIKPRVDQLGDLNAIQVNSVFPRILANFCCSIGANLIHPTTDCVYSGLKGNYSENDKYDVNDVYGMSKAMGEPQNCTIIRTSIIGEEIGQSRSLVEWVKSNAGNTVFGFTNHFWNGVTCLQFAKICKQIIDNHMFWKGTKHIYSNSVTKKELVETISEVYGLNITVTPKETEVMCDRTLSTVNTLNKELNIPLLKDQIIEMKDFSETLHK